MSNTLPWCGSGVPHGSRRLWTTTPGSADRQLNWCRDHGDPLIKGGTQSSSSLTTSDSPREHIGKRQTALRRASVPFRLENSAVLFMATGIPWTREKRLSCDVSLTNNQRPLHGAGIPAEIKMLDLTTLNVITTGFKEFPCAVKMLRHG